MSRGEFNLLAENSIYWRRVGGRLDATSYESVPIAFEAARKVRQVGVRATLCDAALGGG